MVKEAIDRGAKIATHLGNGAANMINRHRNPFWSQLADDRLTASIICDGFHLLPEEIKTFHAAKGTGRTIITSDVTSYAALEPGIFHTQTGETIELTDEGMLRYPAQNVFMDRHHQLQKELDTSWKLPAVLWRSCADGQYQSGKFVWTG